MIVAYVIKAIVYVLYSKKDTKKEANKMHKAYVIIYFLKKIKSIHVLRSERANDMALKGVNFTFYFFLEVKALSQAMLCMLRMLRKQQLKKSFITDALAISVFIALHRASFLYI